MIISLKRPTIGPILGARTYGDGNVAQSVMVRGRDEWADQTCFFHLTSDDGREDSVFKIPISKHSRQDVTGRLILKGLTYDTNYRYRVGMVSGNHAINTAKNAILKGGLKGSFSTSNPDTSVTRFVFGSCCHFSLLGINQADDAAFKTMYGQWFGPEQIKDDFILMLGDQIYGDHYNKRGLVATLPILDKRKLTLNHYLSHYKKAFGKRHKRTVMASIPTYMIFDDHEVHNNWGSNAFFDDHEDFRVLRDALHAYHLYQVSHPDIKIPRLSDIAFEKPLPKAKYYYEFTHGKNDFFVMDTRYEKIPQKQNLRMISKTQMSELKAFLSRGQNRIKFIVSSVPMLPDAELSKLNQVLDTSPEDRWEGHTDQRKEILDHIKRNCKKGKNPNVIVLSGDVHVSYAFSLISDDDSSFKLHQITSSAFNWGIGLQDSNFSKSAPLRGTDKEYRPKNLSGRVIHNDNFCRVIVKTDKVDIRFYHAKSGKTLKTVTLDLILPVEPS